MTQFETISPLHPLLQEIEKQTNPHNFMDPYDAPKVKRANELHQEVYQVNIRKVTSVMELIIRTMDDLDCTYEPQLIYQYLHEQFDPTKHNPEFDRYNNLCQKIFQFKDSIRNMNQVIEEENAKRGEERKGGGGEEEEKWDREDRDFVIAMITIVTILLLFAVVYTQCQH